MHITGSLELDHVQFQFQYQTLYFLCFLIYMNGKNMGDMMSPYFTPSGQSNQSVVMLLRITHVFWSLQREEITLY